MCISSDGKLRFPYSNQIILFPATQFHCSVMVASNCHRAGAGVAPPSSISCMKGVAIITPRWNLWGPTIHRPSDCFRKPFCIWM
jgi:hypothetical protein